MGPESSRSDRVLAHDNDHQHERGRLPTATGGQRSVRYRVAGTVLESLNDTSRDWFNKHGFVTYHRSLQLLNAANAVITDDEFFANEAIALGKPAFMMTEGEGVTRVTSREKRALTKAEDFITALLEVTK
jgi:hypothetical protein